MGARTSVSGRWVPIREPTFAGVHCNLDRQAIRPREIPSATLSRTPLGVPADHGGLVPGVFALLDPRRISVTPTGVGVLERPGRSQTTPREPGPPCPAAGCPSKNPRSPGCIATWIGRPFDRAKFHRPRFHAPLSGCRPIMGDWYRGCSLARPPAHFCDPDRGRQRDGVAGVSSGGDLGGRAGNPVARRFGEG
jgi:hypothetical protein